MKNSTIKVLCKVLCIVLIATFTLEAPLTAAPSAINVNVGGENIAVTPGQWVSVQSGPVTSHYNVRYVDGQPMALEMSQYMDLVFNGGSGAAAAKAGSAAAAKAGSTAAAQTTVNAADTAVAKSSGGSWISNEVSAYGQNIRDSYHSGQEAGQTFGTKTVDGVKTGASKVGGAVSSTGSKLGNLLSGARDRISNLFSRKPAVTKDAAASKAASQQSGDASQAAQSGDAAAQKAASKAAAQSGDASQAAQSGDASQAAQKAAAQSGDASQAAQSGDASQAAQSGDASQAAQSGDASQAAQSGEAAAQKAAVAADAAGSKVVAGESEGFFSKTGQKFQAGYETGKVMTNQGFNNVKSTFKAGFSPKSILMTAGITVGVDLVSQMMSGERPSIGKAVRTVASAEFVGGVTGAVTGAAAGSFFVPFLSAIPVVGGVLGALAPTFGAVAGGSFGAYLAGDLRNGKFSIREAFRQIDWVSVSGQAIGSTAGMMLGSMIFPPFGTIVGGIAGGMLGRWAAQRIAGMFGRGSSSFGSIGMPVGSNPFGGAPVGQVSGPVSIGAAAAGGGEIPVTGAQAPGTPQISIAGSSQPMGTYSSEVQLAEAKYKELYKLYNEMLSQGRQDDAMKVAQEMNRAKAEYESLKARAGQ